MYAFKLEIKRIRPKVNLFTRQAFLAEICGNSKLVSFIFFTTVLDLGRVFSKQAGLYLYFVLMCVYFIKLRRWH